MGAQYSLSAGAFMDSKTTFVPVDLTSTVSVYKDVYLVAQAKMFPDIHIQRDVKIIAPGIGVASVISPFYVRVQRTEEGFLATSDISDVYEVGESIGQTVTDYLHSLVDELIWFQEHKESLSSSMLKDFAKLQFYMDLV